MADLGGVWLFGCKVKVPHACAELSLRPIGYMLALPVTQSFAAAAVCGLWCCVSVGPSSVAQGYHFFVEFLETWICREFHRGPAEVGEERIERQGEVGELLLSRVFDYDHVCMLHTT